MAPLIRLSGGIPLPGYCNHVEVTTGDGCVWLTADADPTIQILRSNAKKGRWDVVFDLVRDFPAWPKDLKPALGHTCLVDTQNVHLFVPYKHVNGKAFGIYHVVIVKSSLPPL